MQHKLKVKNKGQVPNLKKGPTQISRKRKQQNQAKKTALLGKPKARTEGEKLRQALVKDMNDKILAQVTRKANQAGTTLNIVKLDEK